jgi:radical SAM superfamily enzyme YgiQ (UPF0313 family)
VDILDLCLADDYSQAIEQYFARNDVFAIGLNLRNIDNMSLNTPEFYVPQFKEIINLVKARTSAPLIIGGAGFSLMPETVMDYCDVDLGVYGEGELAFPLLLGKLQRCDGNLSDVPGLVYRADGKFRRNPAQQLDLSKLPAPRRGAIDNSRYFLEGGIGFVECRRGCSKHCIYCPDPWFKGTKLRFRSPDSIADEIEELLKLKIDHVYFCDSEFNVPDESVAREVCLKLIERGLSSKVRWYADVIPLPFSPDLVSLFLKAGCAGLAFNVDVCNEQMLRNLSRDFSVSDIKQAAEACQQHNLPFIYYLLLGGPGETRETLRETIETVKEIGPGVVETVPVMRIYPGTKLAEMVKRAGPLSENPNLQGQVAGNESFLAPIFYVSSALGPEEEWREYIANLIAGDERFLFASKKTEMSLAHLGPNELLTQAFKAGYRGIHWDVMRRLREDGTLERWRRQRGEAPKGD